VSSPSDDQLPGEPERRAQPSTQEIPMIDPSGATAAGHLGAPQGGAFQHPVAAPLPPHPGAVTPAPVAVDEPQPTGPVDFVPNLPGTPPVPPPVTAASPPPPVTSQGDGAVWPDTLESELLQPGERGATEKRGGTEKKVRRVRAPRDRAAVLGIGLAVLALVLVELGLGLDFGRQSYWSAVPLWSAFATLCAVLGVAAFAAAFPSGSRLRPGGVWRIAAAGLVGLAVFWVLVVLPVVASDRGFLLTAALGALGAAVWVGPARKA
jgi:hypothetical protein